ncbi:MAG: sulfatase-like hydrolase/transferase [Opitutaceae bacterium]|nr:sulfatase-like hydrolase/transferase [Opitutaceae bacterium]
MNPLPRCARAALFCFSAGLALAAEPPPNLVFILTDNQGAWTLGSYGNPDIRTPHIDRLAAEGVRFTRAMSSNPVCSPTRATYLTGLIPSQHGVHSFLDPKFMMGPEAYNTLREFTSLGEILRDAGYTCGLSGKWHLGDNLKPNEGFSFWVTKPDGHTTEFYDQNVIEDGALRKEAGYTTDLWTRKAIAFLEQNRTRPFFLFLAYNGPYVLGQLMRNPPRNRHADYYRGKKFASFPVEPMHPWQNANKPFHNTQLAMERTAAEVSGVDDGVGEVMAALERLGLGKNTVVVYTSDQGWMGGQNGMWGMGDHFRPVAAHDLMFQVPLIFRHPGRIPAGRTSDLLVSNYDFLPTVLAHLGLGSKMPAAPRSPGRSYAAALRGESPAWDNTVFYEMEVMRGVRAESWKYTARHPAGPFELYDLAADPMERNNLHGQPGTEAKRAELAARLDAFFAQHADPKWDVWRGGGSKAKLHTR